MLLPGQGRGLKGTPPLSPLPPPPLPAQVRFSWATCNPSLDACAVPVKWECEEEGGQQQRALSTSGAEAQAAPVLVSSGSGRCRLLLPSCSELKLKFGPSLLLEGVFLGVLFRTLAARGLAEGALTDSVGRLSQKVRSLFHASHLLI